MQHARLGLAAAGKVLLHVIAQAVEAVIVARVGSSVPVIIPVNLLQGHAN